VVEGAEPRFFGGPADKEQPSAETKVTE